MRRLEELYLKIKKDFFDSPKFKSLVASQQRTLEKLNRVINLQANAKDAHQQVSKGTQIQLMLKYRELAERGVILPFNDVGFKNYSQMEEDGILHYIFSVVGTTNRKSVELCAGVGSESLSANLIINHSWHSLLVDGLEDNVNRGRKFFAKHPNTRVITPIYINRWVDRESVNTILTEENFTGEIDLFILDMDGIDYWIWDAITEISPRVVVVEVQPHFNDRSVTVPYDPNFKAELIQLAEKSSLRETESTALPKRTGSVGDWVTYGGASLMAFNKLAQHRGYRFIGANVIGFNAFFMRDDVGCEFFPEVSCDSCINPNYDKDTRALAIAKLEEYEWVQI